MPPAIFVDTLNANAGMPLSIAERDSLVADLVSGIKSRAQVLRTIAEDADFVSAEPRSTLRAWLRTCRCEPGISCNTTPL
jgi:hypothetical protein